MFAVLWDMFVEYQDIYISGIKTALLAAAISLITSCIVGLIGGVIRYFTSGLVSRLVAAYVSLIRNTPMLVQIYFIFFGMPSLGVTLDAFSTGIIALTFNAGAYLIEIFRGGLEAIPKGQTEASDALGMSKLSLLFKILLPQAWPIMIPAITGQFVQLIKDTSLLFTVAVIEITKAADLVANDNYKFLEAYSVGCLIYIVICITLNVIVDALEARFGMSKNGRIT